MPALANKIVIPFALCPTAVAEVWPLAPPAGIVFALVTGKMTAIYGSEQMGQKEKGVVGDLAEIEEGIENRPE